MMKCAFYEREITPPLGSHLSGYANIRKANGLKDRLMAKACVFSNGGETIAFIAVDALHMENELRNAVATLFSFLDGSALKRGGNCVTIPVS